MKKILAMLLAALMVFALVSCNPDDNNDGEDVTVRVMALKGPTGMGMVQLMENSANGTSQNKYDIKLAAAPEEVSAAVIAGTVDIAAVPVNLAAVLFNIISVNFFLSGESRSYGPNTACTVFDSAVILQ